MTDLVLTTFNDAWVNSLKTGVNYGSTNAVHIKFGERRGYIRPQLPQVAGRTVLEAILYGRPQAALEAQELSLIPATERWTPGNVTWSNQPAVDVPETILTDIAAAAIDDLVEIAVVTDHIQAVADGSPWYGWRLGTDSTATNQQWRSFESGHDAWELHLSLSDAPNVPDDLRPDGGNISSTTPTLSWTFADAGLGSTAQAESQVQVDTPTGGADPDEVTPDYDSGWESNGEPEWDLDAEHTLVGAGPHYWRVQVADGDGNISGWSDWAEFGIATKPTLVIDAPTGAIGDPSPTVLAHLSSGGLKYWFARATGSDRSDIRARSGNQTGAVEWQVPLRGPDGRRVLRDEVASWIYVRVYPAGDWTTAVGEPTYLEEWIPVTWDDDGGIIAPTDLSVAPLAPGDPRHVWTFEMTDVPESFVFMVNGETVAQVGADDLDVDAGVYTYTDLGVIPPLRSYTLSVRAISDNGRSAAATQAGYSHNVSGVWLMPEDEDIEPVQLAGTGVGDWIREDHRATYVTSTGEQVDLIYGKPSRSGVFEGSVDSRDGEAKLWAAVTTMNQLRNARLRFAQMIWGSQSVRVRLRDPDVTSSPNMLPNNLEHVVRFGFVQVPD